MFKGMGRAGGKTAMAAGAAAAGLLALGLWLGGKRDSSDTVNQQATVQPPRENTGSEIGSETATLSPDAVQGASIGPEGTAATEPKAVDPETAEPPAAESQVAEPPATETERAPAFDEVRRDPDGMTVIAGRAAPGSVVTVLKDGEELVRATADGAGKFATLAMIPPDGAGHVLTLMSGDGDRQIVSAEEIILAPIAAPVALAEAEGVAEADARPEARETDAPEEGQDAAALSDARAAADAAADAATPAEEAQEPVENALIAQREAAEEAAPDQREATAEVEELPAETPADPAAPGLDEATALAQADSAEVASAAPPVLEEDAPSIGAAAPAGDPDAVAEDAATESTVRDATPLAGTGLAEGDQRAEAESVADAPQEAPADSTGVADTMATPAPRPPASRPPADDALAAAPENTLESPAPQGSEATTAPAPDIASDIPSAPAAPAPTAAETTTAEASPDAAATTAPRKPPAPATAPVAVLKSTAEGVERLDTAPPQVMTNVALDTIGYSDQGDVQLAGRAQPDTREVRVYLNNDAIISLPVDQQGRWRGDLPDVDEGIYTLRVDELSQAGEVTSRVETPFKRESPQTLAEASAGLTGPLGVVTVQKGDTLWAISRARYGDPFLYVKVFEANSDNIRDPDLIYPGQVFDLPETTPAE
ncbi:LysM peptidoglycan-binding domain-containing protein [Sulfitobacter sp. PS-8MA]|uniref:LysM peptidoglycan-binding domain-containing protein n=1 Tax=Sulfitobacter sp. PS-8MA TaxID=3237707 RepID=UPI0034C6856B